MKDVTYILGRIEDGDLSASEQLLPLVYEELRKLAAVRMANERKDHTLQGTALVHEAYLRLVGSEDTRRWRGRTHFFTAAAEAMRRVLIQEARRKKSEKRGGAVNRVDAEIDQISAPDREERLLDIDEALQRLEQMDSQKADLVKLRYFVGMTVQEAAESLGISVATAERQWAYVRSWLQCELNSAGSS